MMCTSPVIPADWDAAVLQSKLQLNKRLLADKVWLPEMAHAHKYGLE